MIDIDEPSLGLATTEQLLREIIYRFTIPPTWSGTSNALILAEMLGSLSSEDREYRTVDN